MSAVRNVATCLLFVALAGCTSVDDLQQRIAWRWGPDPAMPATQFNSTIADQIQVINYIKDNAPIDPNAPDYFFQMAEWGFDVGRQDCE
jgi:hypothetical protein